MPTPTVIPVTLTPQSLDLNVCYKNEQERFSDYAAHLAASIPSGFTPVIVSSASPSPDNRTAVWVQVDGNNAILDVLTFSNGAWNGLPKPWIPGEFKYYDPSFYTPLAPWYPCDGSVTGVPDLRGRFIVATGQRTTPPVQTFTLADGTIVTRQDNNTNFAQGAIGGEETHVLIEGELPNLNLQSHLHTSAGAGSGGGAYADAQGSTPNTTGEAYAALDGDFDAHNNLPPYYALAMMQWRPDLS